MKRFDECPPGTRVAWKPSNNPDKEYKGVVIAHTYSGMDIYTINGYDEHKAGYTKPIVQFDRVVVAADHDHKWHAQPLQSLHHIDT